MACPSQVPVSTASEVDVVPGRLRCPVPGKAGTVGRHPLTPTGEPQQAGFLERVCPRGPELLPADAHVYPGWAGATWMLGLGQELGQLLLDSPQARPGVLSMWLRHKAYPVSNLVFLVFPAKLASVTLYYCHLPFRSLLGDSFLNKKGKGSNLWQGSRLLLIANSLKYHFPGAAGLSVSTASAGLTFNRRVVIFSLF